MIPPELRAEMRRIVLREGWRIGTVARRLGVHHSTIRRALNLTVPARSGPAVSALDPFKPYIVSRLSAHPYLSAPRLLAELRDRGCPLGVHPLRRYIAQIRAPRERKVYPRVESEPPEPILTGNPAADDLDVEPHDLETYDALGQPEPPEDGDPTE